MAQNLFGFDLTSEEEKQRQQRGPLPAMVPPPGNPAAEGLGAYLMKIARPTAQPAPQNRQTIDGSGYGLTKQSQWDQMFPQGHNQDTPALDPYQVAARQRQTGIKPNFGSVPGVSRELGRDMVYTPPAGMFTEPVFQAVPGGGRTAIPGTVGAKTPYGGVMRTDGPRVEGQSDQGLPEGIGDDWLQQAFGEQTQGQSADQPTGAPGMFGFPTQPGIPSGPPRGRTPSFSFGAGASAPKGPEVFGPPAPTPSAPLEMFGPPAPPKGGFLNYDAQGNPQMMPPPGPDPIDRFLNSPRGGNPTPGPGDRFLDWLKAQGVIR